MNKHYTVQDIIDNPKGCFNKLLLWSCLGFILIILIGLVLPKPDNTSNKNVIEKTTFNGKWSLTVDQAEIYCARIDNNLNGAKIVIDKKEYALTRNLTEIEFLPNKYWKNAEFETINNQRVCSDIIIDNTCKVSLFDLTQYAETLCN